MREKKQKDNTTFFGGIVSNSNENDVKEENISNPNNLNNNNNNDGEAEYNPIKEIPKSIHKIWLGSPLPKKLQNLLVQEKNNLGENFTIYLWMDKSILNTSDLAEMESFCQQNKIRLRDPSELKTFVNKEFYAKELEHGIKNGEATKMAGYVSASDILRYEILYNEGGVYADAADYFDQPYEYDFDKMKSDTQATFFNTLGMGRGYTNNYIVSAPHTKFLDLLISKINNKYSKLTEKLWESHWDKKGDIEGSIFDLTGPDLVNKLAWTKGSGCAMIEGTVRDSGGRRSYPGNHELKETRSELYSMINQFIDENNLIELRAHLNAKGQKKIHSAINRENNNFKLIKFISNFQDVIDRSGCSDLKYLFGSDRLNLLSLDSVQEAISKKILPITGEVKQLLVNAINKENSFSKDLAILKNNIDQLASTTDTKTLETQHSELLTKLNLMTYTEADIKMAQRLVESTSIFSMSIQMK